MTNPNFEEDKLLKDLVLQCDPRKGEFLIGAIAYAIYRRKLDVFVREQRSPITADSFAAAKGAFASDILNTKEEAALILNDYVKTYNRKGFWYGVWQGVVASVLFSSILFGLAFIVRLSRPNSGIGVVIQYLFSDGEFEIREIKPKEKP